MKKIKSILIYILLIIAVKNITAQPIHIIDSKKAYKNSVELNEKNKLINLVTLIPTIQLDLRYSTTNNFTNTNLYKKATTTYLRYDAGNALLNANITLQKLGYTFKIYDAYRPYSATKLMWELIKDERYVANPKSGSNHNRGLSIDLTIVDKNGNELPMGTGFDNFTDTAHHSFTNLSPTILANRKLLKETMEANGFKPLETEWWHYTFITTDVYNVIDLSFKVLKKIVK
jgi:zinc D-Ala-D-Ala dipeptidase